MSHKFSLCESVSASGHSPWHIRELSKNDRLKLSGGIDTGSLCGTVKTPYGWDLKHEVDEFIGNDCICKTCKAFYFQKKDADAHSE
jgi:hypothetical protein